MQFRVRVRTLYVPPLQPRHWRRPENLYTKSYRQRHKEKIRKRDERNQRPYRKRTRRNRKTRLYRILPHRLGLYQRRPKYGHFGRTGSWLGRRLDSRVPHRHNQHRPPEIRPLLRAFPKPRKGLRARFRRRLRR